MIKGKNFNEHKKHVPVFLTWKLWYSPKFVIKLYVLKFFYKYIHLLFLSWSCLTLYTFFMTQHVCSILPLYLQYGNWYTHTHTHYLFWFIVHCSFISLWSGNPLNKSFRLNFRLQIVLSRTLTQRRTCERAVRNGMLWNEYERLQRRKMKGDTGINESVCASNWCSSVAVALEW